MKRIKGAAVAACFEFFRLKPLKWVLYPAYAYMGFIFVFVCIVTVLNEVRPFFTAAEMLIFKDAIGVFSSGFFCSLGEISIFGFFFAYLLLFICYLIRPGFSERKSDN